ncbi:hydroxysqualene dehydroxylase HpnE [Sciscionella marina]|uniref:hydroxysqualene dehydroxylase HpnE n=1 Tax=Sciscionella marina TaxID=508770 RepID=UPI00036EF938|nr:hydroxysqualene dehydroxylase HpnE [Sciscionella marina]
MRAIVAGGGLAGLTAACSLVDRGWSVTVLEERARLGGATFSFTREGLVIDNGQHVLLRCYTEYLGWLRRLGVEHEIEMQPRFRIPVQRPGGNRYVLERTPGLPAPLHLGPALARYGLLGLTDRLRVLRGVDELRKLELDNPALDEQRFGTWLRRAGQNDRTIEALWNLITVAALNTEADNAALSLCAMVFRTALLENADSADIGIPRVPLQRLHGEAAEKYLRDRGASVRTDTPARRITPDADGFTVELDGERLEADRVVLAVPARKAAELAPKGSLRTPSGYPEELGTSPILNLHVVYDREVLDEQMLAFVDSPVQWVFDRTAISGLTESSDDARKPSGAQYLAVSLSAAEELIDEPTANLRKTFLPELSRVLPAAAAANVESFFVTRERHATFRQGPGTAVMRANPASKVPGLVLAGAWTGTGWPDTMEGAVRSGLDAARLIGRPRLQEGT